MDFDFTSIGEGKITNVNKFLTVGRDKSTGEIIGWDTFYKFVETDDGTEDLISELKEKQDKRQASFTILPPQSQSFTNTYMLIENSTQIQYPVKVVVFYEG